MRGLTEAIVLSVLASGEDYAHGIVKAVARVSEGRIQLHRSSVHYALRRLVRERLAMTHWRVISNGMREEERCHYRLTVAGQAAFGLFSAVLEALWARHAAEAPQRPKRASGL